MDLRIYRLVIRLLDELNQKQVELIGEILYDD